MGLAANTYAPVGAFFKSPAERTALVTANKTLAIEDQGVVQVVTADAKVITLPATVVGYSFIVENGGDDGDVAVTIAPNAVDLIAGNGFTAADDKDVVNTKATAKKGDRIQIVGNGTTGWNIVAITGIWAREA